MNMDNDDSPKRPSLEDTAFITRAVRRPALEDAAFITRAVHAGERRPAGDQIPVATPIHPAVGYSYPAMDRMDRVLGAEEPGYVYSTRYANPTTAALEEAVTLLEEGEAAHAFASGMAAIHAAVLAAGVRAGSTVVAAMDVYGATYSLLQSLFGQLGVQVHFVDILDLDAVAAALSRSRPDLLIAETISNPLLKVADLPRLATMAHEHGARLLVDNTFASPYLCRPLTLGADMVVHSATKYLAGHGDVMAGMVVTNAALRHQLYEVSKLVGGTLGPFESWLVLRGLKTLPLRMNAQCSGAAAVARWLPQQPRVAQVHYPGLPDHPSHLTANRLLDQGQFGAMISFVLEDADQAAVFCFMENLRLIQPVTSLGDIYSLLLHPATSSHRGLTPAERAAVGIPDGLVRLSVGIEAPADVIADLQQALGAA